MRPFRHVLDFEHRRAVVPGDGAQAVSFLHSRDLAGYVVGVVGGEGEGDMPEFSAFVGDRMSWGEVVRVAERVTGEFSFEIGRAHV